MPEKKELITASGVLYPIFESQGGSVTGVMLSANDDKEYLIVGDRYISELINLCQEEVRIRGRRHLVSGQWQLEPLDYEISVRDDYDAFLDELDFKDEQYL